MTVDNIIGRQLTMLEVMGPSRSGPQDDSGQHHRTAVNHAPDDTPDDSIDKVLGQQFHPAHRLADGSARARAPCSGEGSTSARLCYKMTSRGDRQRLLSA